MAVAFGVSQPKHLALARLHLSHSRLQQKLRLGLRRISACGEELFGNLFDGSRARPAPVVAQQVGGDAEKIKPRCCFTVRGEGRSARRAEEAHVAFLHQVVSQRGVGGGPRQVGPEGARGARIERGEGLVLHRRVTRAGGCIQCAAGRCVQQCIRQCEFPRHESCHSRSFLRGGHVRILLGSRCVL